MTGKNDGVNHLSHPSQRQILRNYLNCYYTVHGFSTFWMAFGFYGSWRINLGLGFICLAVSLFLIVGVVGANILLKRLFAPSFDCYQMKSDLKFLARLNSFIILLIFLAFFAGLVYTLFYSNIVDLREIGKEMAIFGLFAGSFLAPFVILVYYEKGTAEALQVFTSTGVDDEVVLVVGEKYQKDLSPKTIRDDDPEVLMI